MIWFSDLIVVQERTGPLLAFHCNTVESRNFLQCQHNIIIGNQGEGQVMRRIVTVPRDDHYRPTIATWARDLTFTAWLFEQEENDKVRDTSS